MVMMLGRCELFAVPAALVSRGATIAGLMSRRCEIRIKTNQEKRCSALCSGIPLPAGTCRKYVPQCRQGALLKKRRQAEAAGVEKHIE